MIITFSLLCTFTLVIIITIFYSNNNNNNNNNFVLTWFVENVEMLRATVTAILLNIYLKESGMNINMQLMHITQVL